MALEQLVVVAVLLSLVTGLVFTRVKPSFLFVGAISLCYIMGVIDLQGMLSNFANTSLVTLVLLILVSIAIEKTALFSWLTELISRGTLKTTTTKLGLSTALLSSITNNTAVVATFIAAVKENTRFPPSKLLLPLSYTAILGGTLTLIGTSTNLIVDGFMQEAGLPGLAFFDLSLIGLGALASGLIVIVLSSVLLPEYEQSKPEKAVFYLQADVLPNSPLIGRTVEANGLRQLKTLFLAEIVRGDCRIVPVSPQEELQADDRLLFVGDIEQVNVLNGFEGLSIAGQMKPGQQVNELIEVVVSHSSSIVGKTLKQSGFRERFDAVVLAVRRGQERLIGGLGVIELKPGDCLVLAPGETFHERADLTREFVYTSGIDVKRELNNRQSGLVLCAFLSVIIGAVAGGLSLVKGLMVLLVLLLLSGVIRPTEIQRRFPLDVFAMVGSAIGLAQLMISTGVAESISSFLIVHLNGFGVLGAFIGIYFITVILTELVTNNAAAALSFPVAYTLSQSFEANYMPFVMAVIFGASASFISPFGYQTNLMVFSAGNYQLRDYVRVGVPLSVVYSATVLCLIPLVFPF